MQTTCRFPFFQLETNHPFVMDIQFLLNDPNTDKSNKTFIRPACHLCTKTFHNHHARKRHISTVHTSAMTCPYCSKSLKIAGRPDLLKQHLVRCRPFQQMTNGNLSNNFLKTHIKTVYEHAIK